MLNASGPQAGQHGDSRAMICFDGVDSVLRADPQAPLAHGRTMATGRIAVKRMSSASSRHTMGRGGGGGGTGVKAPPLPVWGSGAAHTTRIRVLGVSVPPRRPDQH